MSVSASDIVVYGSANMQETNTGTQGGAIDETTKIVFTDISATDEVEILSSASGDVTQVVTITGRDAGGSIVSEQETLTGTTPVTTTQTFERILKIAMDSSATGIVTVRKESDDVTIATLEAGITTVRRPFYNAQAEASGGSEVTYYEKVFVKNENTSGNLLGVAFYESADNLEATADVQFAIEDAVDDSGTSTNRLTAPATGDVGPAGFSDTSKTLASQLDSAVADLGSGQAVGIWLALVLPAGATPQDNTFILGISGSTT